MKEIKSSWKYFISCLQSQGLGTSLLRILTCHPAGCCQSTGKYPLLIRTLFVQISNRLISKWGNHLQPNKWMSSIEWYARWGSTTVVCKDNCHVRNCLVTDHSLIHNVAKVLLLKALICFKKLKHKNTNINVIGWSHYSYYFKYQTFLYLVYDIAL